MQVKIYKGGVKMTYVVKCEVLNLGCGRYNKTFNVEADNEDEAKKELTNKYLITNFISIKRVA